jgi:hypothetical protein
MLDRHQFLIFGWELKRTTIQAYIRIFLRLLTQTKLSDVGFLA